MDADRTRATTATATPNPANPNPTAGRPTVVGPAPAAERPADRSNGHSAGANGDSHPIDAFKSAFSLWGEFLDYLAYWFSAKVDGVKVTLRNVGVYAGLGVIGLFVAAGLAVTAAVLLLVGIAHGIDKAMPTWAEGWFGELIVAILVLGGIAGGAFWFMGKLTNGSRDQTIDKYEAKRRQQRVDYGHDVNERASEHVEQSK